jgi:hypothetical protein
MSIHRFKMRDWFLGFICSKMMTMITLRCTLLHQLGQILLSYKRSFLWAVNRFTWIKSWYNGVEIRIRKPARLIKFRIVFTGFAHHYSGFKSNENLRACENFTLDKYKYKSRGRRTSHLILSINRTVNG